MSGRKDNIKEIKTKAASHTISFNNHKVKRKK